MTTYDIEYYRAYREKHREKIREYMRNWYAAHRERQQEYERNRYWEAKERGKLTLEEFMKDHPVQEETE